MSKNLNYIKTGFAAAVLAGTGMASENVSPVEPGTDSTSLAYLSNRVSSVMARSGLQFGGDFYTRGLISAISGNRIDSSTNAKKLREDVMYTALDLDMHVGPTAAIQGHASIRLHEDWRNMFGSYQTPLNMRWISVDGNVKNMFFYNIGDFKQKYSSLTLWAPEPEIMYEPYIFARQRQIVMNEVFAGNNQRVLQGANFGFNAKISPVFEELGVKGFFTRTRWQGKEEDNIRPEATDSKLVPMSRYSAGSDLFMKFRHDAELGGTFVYSGDALNTHKEGNAIENKADVDKNMVFGFNGAIGTGLIQAIDTNNFNFRIDLQGAASLTKNYKVTGTGKEAVAVDTSRIGIASNFNAGFKIGLNDAGKLKLDIGGVYNDTGFVNELAQSPVFYNRQIMNTSVEGAYSSFDGLYKTVYRYTPAVGELAIKEPQNKIAWTRGVMTAEELAGLKADGGIPSGSKVALDETFSPVMYFGDATPNRLGLTTDFSGDFLDKAILFNLKVNLFKTPKWDVDADGFATKSQFMQYGGGASLDVAKFGDWWSYPLVLSGSYLHTNRDLKNDVAAIVAKSPLDLMNGSLYWKFWKRAALLGGAQVLMAKTSLPNADGQLAEVAKSMETNLAGGLEYTVTEGGVLSMTVGNIGVKDNLVSKNSFNTMQYDLLLTVKF